MQLSIEIFTEFMGNVAGYTEEFETLEDAKKEVYADINDYDWFYISDKNGLVYKSTPKYLTNRSSKSLEQHKETI